MEGHQLMDWLRSRWDWIVRNKFVTCVIVWLLVFGVVVVCRHWGWIVTESGSTIIRNLGLVVGGLIAIGFGVWRGVVADRQAKASQDQAKTSQRSLLNERYQRGAEMLGRPVLAVRLGGIYALRHLAEDAPKLYHVQIMRLLCAFVRNPPVDKDRDDNARPTGTERKPNIKGYQVREDVQEAMTAIGTRSDTDVELEKKADPPFLPDLSDAYLPFVWLHKANLTGADLTHARFYPENLTVQEQPKNAELLMADAYLQGANLSNAFLTGADLTCADLSANLSNTVLVGANLTDAFLSKAKGLTQDQLGQACADPDNPPNLGSLCDAETGAPLEWGDKPCR